MPEENLYIVILRNRSDIYFKTPPNVIGNMIADIVLGYNDDKERIAIRLTDEQLKKYIGVYQFVESPGKRKISFIEGKVYYERPPRNTGDPWSQNHIIPMSVNEFFAEGRKSTISFQFNSKNEVIGMNVNQAFGRVVKLTKIE